MSNGILNSIEKLRGTENYSTWKFAMENFLAHEGLDKCIIATGTETDATKNVKAKSSLVLSCDKCVYTHIATADTALKVWESLRKTFSDSGIGRKFRLVKAGVTTRLETCDSMETYVNTIITGWQGMAELGYALEDDLIALFLLCGLPEEYEPMIMALDNIKGEKLKSEEVKAKLLQEKRDVTSTEGAFFGKRGTNKPNNKHFKCYSCNQKGHKANQCPNRTDSKAGSKSNKQAAFSACFLSGNFGEDN